MNPLQKRLSQLYHFIALPNQDKRILLAAFFVLSATVAGLHIFGYKRWYSFLKGGVDRVRWPILGGDPYKSIRRTRFLLNLIVIRTPWPGKCLSQSLTLWWLLRRQGVHTDVRIGVHNSTGALQAHAWLEFDGQPINDSPDVGIRYAVFTNSAGTEHLNFAGSNPRTP